MRGEIQSLAVVQLHGTNQTYPRPYRLQKCENCWGFNRWRIDRDWPKPAGLTRSSRAWPTFAIESQAAQQAYWQDN